MLRNKRRMGFPGGRLCRRLLICRASGYRLPVTRSSKNEQQNTSSEIRSAIRRNLLSWYRKNRRALPWREAPTPYQVWVSEVMLQQTRVEVVRDYYTRWMASFPNLKSLAQANDDQVLAIWQGLGYYSRARRLLSGARYVLEEFGGNLPQEPDLLQKIPGIGPYSAGAISSIAFGRPSPIVDGNVIRVLSRIFVLSGDPGRTFLKKKLWAIAGELVPQNSASDFNQALMELGALVCTPTSPACHACPLRKNCMAHQFGEVARFPELKERAKPTELAMAVAVIRHRGRIAIDKLPPDARWWAGLYALPFVELQEGNRAEPAARALASAIAGVTDSEVRVFPSLKHAVTRYKITLTPVLLETTRRLPRTGRVSWMTEADLGRRALPAPHRKALTVALR